MSYEKTTWQTDDTITASLLNKMEQGIAQNASDIEDLSADATTTADAVDELKSDIAPEYSSSSTYAVGEYAMHDAKLYKCNTAITTAEAWTAGHWTSVPLAGDVRIIDKNANVFNPAFWSQGNAISKILSTVPYTLEKVEPVSVNDGVITRYKPETGEFQTLSNDFFHSSDYDVDPNTVYMVMHGLEYTPWIPVGIFKDADGKEISTTELIDTGAMWQSLFLDYYFMTTPYLCRKLRLGQLSTESLPSLYKVTIEKSPRVLENNISKYISELAGESIEAGENVTISGTMQRYYLLAENGSISTQLSADYESWCVSEPIPVEPFSYYKITCSAQYRGHAAYIVYDGVGKVLLSEAVDSSTPSDLLNIVNKTVFMPQNAAYVRLATIYGLDNLSISKVRIKSLNIGGRWVGKKWACIGDSLTDVNVRTTMHYHDYIANDTGITVVNLGKGGTGYKNSYAGNGPFIDRVSQIPLDVDVVTIFGSGNDGSYTIGEPSDTGTETLCGCINETIAAIFDRIATCQLGIVTPTPWINYNPAVENNWMARYSDAIVEICKRWSIPCLDLYHCSNLRPWDADFRAAAYSKDDGNGVHPDETGHAIIAPRFEAFLDELLMH